MRQSNISRTALQALIAQNYPSKANELLRPLLHLFSLAREACGGDMDKYLILMVVAVRTAEHSSFAASTQEWSFDGEAPIVPGWGTNVRSIADSIGAPKETVRRKVGELVEAGWIVREQGELFCTAKAYRDFGHVREAVQGLAVRNFEVVADLVRGSAEPA